MRSAAARRSAQRWAALSRERLTWRLHAELEELRAHAEPPAPGSWQDRELAARPALVRATAGRRVSGAARRRRNTALHARRSPPSGFARASGAELAWAAAGPRLGWATGQAEYHDLEQHDLDQYD